MWSSLTATTLPDTSRFEKLIGTGSIFDTIYSPIARQTVGLGAGDVDFDSYGLNHVFNNQEFGFVPTVPEPGTMLLLGLGLGSLAVARRHRKA